MDGLMELFTLWEQINGLDEPLVYQSDFLERWEEVCWRIQIQLILATDEKASYLNALAALSDRIYERYRKQRKLSFLHSLLNRLASLLEDRDIPERYRRGILKITIMESANMIINCLAKSQLQDSLFGVIKTALKDVTANVEPSRHIANLLKSLTNWIKRQKTISSEVLIDQLILANFNHPAYLEFLFNFYALDLNESVDFAQLKQQHFRLTKMQLRLDALKLQSSNYLFKGSESVADKLQSFFATEMTWIMRRMKDRCADGRSASSDHQPMGYIDEPLSKKNLAKWPSDKSDLVELAYALYVYMRSRGSQITIAALAKWLEVAFGVSLARYSHRFAEIKMRKSTRPSKFLDVMVNEFLNYVEQGNAFEAI